MVSLFPLHYWGRAVVMTRNGQIDGIPLNGGNLQFVLRKKKGKFKAASVLL